MIVSKPVDLAQLQAEMIAAGVAITALGMSDRDLHTYDAQGSSAPLPPEATAVVAAHVPKPLTPPPPTPNIGGVVRALINSPSIDQPTKDALSAVLRGG